MSLLPIDRGNCVGATAALSVTACSKRENVERGTNLAGIDPICLDPPLDANRHDAAPTRLEAEGADLRDTWTLSDLDEARHGVIAGRKPASHAVGFTDAEGVKSRLDVLALHAARRLLPGPSTQVTPARARISNPFERLPARTLS